MKVGQTVNGESAQNLPRKFGALAQLVARNVRIVEVRGSNPLRSTTSLPVLQQSRQGFFYPVGAESACGKGGSGSFAELYDAGSALWYRKSDEDG